MVVKYNKNGILFEEKVSQKRFTRLKFSQQWRFILLSAVSWHPVVWYMVQRNILPHLQDKGWRMFIWSVSTCSPMRLHFVRTCTKRFTDIYIYIYRGCTRRSLPYFRRTFLRLIYTNITKHIYIHVGSWADSQAKPYAGQFMLVKKGWFLWNWY